MNAKAKSVLAVIVGFIVGSVVNMGIIVFGGDIIPPPDGVDVTDMESIRTSMHLFEPEHFLVPFLAHAFGTLVGAYVGARIAIRHKYPISFVIGVMFLLGGLTNVIMLPSPLWFNIIDLFGAYLPTAWLGARLSGVLHK